MKLNRLHEIYECDKDLATHCEGIQRDSFSYWVCLGYVVMMFMLTFGIEASPKENRILQCPERLTTSCPAGFKCILAHE